MILALNLLLMLIWAGLFGSIDFWTLASGFVVSYILLHIVYRKNSDGIVYFGRAPRIIGFVTYYLWELIRSNVTVAYDIVTPQHYMKPGIVAVPLDAKTDFEITLLANLISMTPGTLSLDVSEDRSTLFVHAMYVDDPEDIRRDIKENLERRVLEVIR